MSIKYAEYQLSDLDRTELASTLFYKCWYHIKDSVLLNQIPVIVVGLKIEIKNEGGLAYHKINSLIV